MRAAVSIISAAAFWLHIFLGCCAHHTHGAGGAACAGLAPPAASRSFKADCLRHRHNNSNREISHGDHSHQGHSHRYHAGRRHIQFASPVSEVSATETPATDPPHPFHSHDDNHETHCNYLLAGKTTVVRDTLMTQLSAVTVDFFGFDSVVSQLAIDSTGWQDQTGDLLCAPARLHLLKQVMLI